MTIYKTKGQAMKNTRGNETYRKVSGGWAVMTWEEYRIQKKQK